MIGGGDGNFHVYEHDLRGPNAQEGPARFAARSSTQMQRQGTGSCTIVSEPQQGTSIHNYVPVREDEGERHLEQGYVGWLRGCWVVVCEEKGTELVESKRAVRSI